MKRCFLTINQSWNKFLQEMRLGFTLTTRKPKANLLNSVQKVKSNRKDYINLDRKWRSLWQFRSIVRGIPSIRQNRGLIAWSNFQEETWIMGRQFSHGTRTLGLFRRKLDIYRSRTTVFGWFNSLWLLHIPEIQKTIALKSFWDGWRDTTWIAPRSEDHPRKQLDFSFEDLA